MATNPSPTNADEEDNTMPDRYYADDADHFSVRKAPPNTDADDELDEILQEFGNHVWQCAQLHQGWHPSSVKSKLQAWRQAAVDTAVREAREVLIQSYEAKVQDFASETRRTTELMQTLHEVRNSLMDYHHSSGFHAKNCDRCAAVEIIEAALHLTQEEES